MNPSLLYFTNEILSKVRLQLTALLLLFSPGAWALNITIVESQSAFAGHDMDVEWFNHLLTLGHTPVIVPQTTLDNNTFFTTTDILIVSSGVITIPANRVNTIIQFLQTGKPVYLQSEYQATYSSNQAYATIIATLGGTFQWTTAFSGDLQPMNVLGTYATTPTIVSPLSYFWYSVAGTGDCNLHNILEYGGAHHGFQYVPLNTSWGSIITTADQDWVRTTTSPNLLTNIIHHLINPPPSVGGPPITLGNDTTLCQGQSILLNATTANATYNWSNGSTAPTLTVTQSGTYWVQVTVSGCSSLDTIVVDFTAAPFVALGNDTALCQGQSLLLDATLTGVSYLWSDGSTTPTLTVTQSGTYWVEVSNSCGTATDTMVVSFTPIPVINLGNDTTLCQGDVFFSDVTTPGATYLWSDGNTNATNTITQSGSYWVEVTVNGCSGTDTITVTFLPLPVISLGNDQTLCDGQTVLLDATTAGATYLWSDGTNNATNTITQSGTYWVEVTVNGCTGTDTVTITFISLPVVNLGNDQTLCDGESALLDATIAGAAYLWSDGTTGATNTITQSGTYWVTVTVNGCVGTDTITVTFLPLPVVNLGNDQTLCSGESALLDVTTTGAAYLWSDGTTGATISVTQSGTYWVEVTVNGCTGKDTVAVTFLPLPVVNLGNDQTLCDGETVLLDATIAGSTYQWNDGTTGATNIIAQSGTYWVEVTLNGCKGSDTVMVTFNPLPVVSLGNDTVICIGQSVILNPDVQGGSYLWQDGTTGAALSVTTEGAYWVQVTVNGCSATDTVSVNTELCEIILVMPNIFTPDQNGLNDTFHPIKMEGVEQATLVVFDRWGKELFETRDLATGWDGTYSGTSCTDGTYYWIVNYSGINNQSGSQSGTVMLMKR